MQSKFLKTQGYTKEGIQKRIDNVNPDAIA